MNTATIPNEAKLRALLDGTLPEAEQAEVLAQVEANPHWQLALDRLAAGAQTWQAAAEHLHEPPPVHDAALRSAMAAAQMQTVDSDQVPTAGGAKLDFLEPVDDPNYLGRFGEYLVERVIGRGGFGIVLRAFDPPLRRIVALKVLAPHLAGNKAACIRFAREAKAAAAVVHDHVITIHSVGDKPLPHLVMQYVAGQSLQEKLDRCGPLEVKEVLRIGMQTAAGLAAAHKHGEIHRDIKPANILLENGIERVKITDFGLARAADDASMTQSGVVAGTPQYMSPEQARGDSVDARSDLFSLGSVMYAMCAGHPPFRATTTMGVLKRVCDDTPRPIRDVNPEVPPWLAEIIGRLMAKNPADRYSSAGEVADLLGQCLSHVQQPGAAPLPQSRPIAPRGPELPQFHGAATSAATGQTADDGQLEHARRAVREPAIGLIIAGIVNVLSLAIAILFLSNFLAHGIFSEARWLIPIIAALGLTSGLMVLGGLKMLRLENRLLVSFAAIAALLVSPGCLVGFAMGLWALVVLSRKDVQRGFAIVARRRWPEVADAPAERPEEGEWSCRCLTCGYVAPAHKWGIVRLGAASRGKRSVLWCPSCRWLRWMAIERFSAKSLSPQKPPLPYEPPLRPAPNSGLGLVLLVLVLVVAVPLTLAAAALLGYFFSHSGSPAQRIEFGPIDRGARTAELCVESPDPRFQLGIMKAPNGCGYATGPFMKIEPNRFISVPLGRYCLRVMDGDVVVQESEFDMTQQVQLLTRRIRPGGTLRLIADKDDRGLVLKLAGFPYRKSWAWPNELRLAVPEGNIHVDLRRQISGNSFQILTDNYFGIVAGQETVIRVLEKDVELVTGNGELDQAIALHRENLQAVETRHSAGQATIVEVIDARLTLREAELQRATQLGQGAQVLEACEQIVALAEENVQAHQTRYEAGHELVDTVNQARLKLLKAKEQLKEAEAMHGTQPQKQTSSPADKNM